MDRDSNIFPNEKHNNHHDEFDKQYEKDFTPTREIPATPDLRAPQFNEANRSCHCGCGCACGAGDGNDAGGDAGSAMDMNREMSQAFEEANSETSSTYGDETAKADEGTEPHLIEVGDFGLIPLELIHRTLAKHSRCTCHHGLLPGDEDYPFTTYNSPNASGFLTPGDPSNSMIVEATSSSGDQSMMSSQVLSICSGGSSLLEFMEGAFDFVQVPIFRPLSLTPEVPFIRYPIDIDISESNFIEYDIW